MPDRFSWTELHAKVHRTLRQRGILGREQAVLVAVSGGQDSLCLLRLLCDLQPKWGWRLGVAHCDHRWRLDSSANARHVEQLAKLWALPFYGQVADRALASEALARQWRYETLAAIAHQHNYTHVATGHTASDRAETLLYNLMRGSGTDGLQALTWQRPLSTGVTLVRPLLEVSRAETAQFCQNGQLPIWEDSTNQNLKYARNRIRNQLLPYLRSHFNPQVEQHLGQTAEILQADVEYLETAAQNLLQQATAVNEYKIQQGEWGTGNGQQGTGNRELNQKSKIQNPKSKIKLNRLILRPAPLALQRRAIRKFLQQVLPCAPNFAQVEKCTALIQAPNRSRTDPFPGGAIATVAGEWIQLEGMGNGEQATGNGE